jgi:alkylated DNA nucleotide flippase Atl1
MGASRIELLPGAGRIEMLFRKERHGQASIALDAGEAQICVAGLGLEGDIHAHRLSPRQVLITLQSELDALQIAPGALHENLVISCAETAYFVPGAALISEGGVEVRLTMFCEPCQRIAPLVANVGGMRQRRGVLGRIEHGGQLRQGDPFVLHPARYRALAESPYQKFVEFVPRIPAGRVVRYGDVAIAIGVAASFVRALPGYLKRSTGSAIPLHRIVDARGMLLSTLPHQAEQLAAEGVRVDIGDTAHATSLGRVDLQTYLWRG